MQKKIPYSLFLLIIIACQPPQDEATRAMSNQLSKLYELSYTNVNYPYHNGLKADHLGRQLKGIPPTAPILVRYQYLTQLVQAGRVEEAIAELMELLDNKPVDRRTLKFFKLLGIAYMQLGEDNNCLHHAGEFACVMPMTADAIHKDKVGAEQAIVTFTKILERYPNEKGIQWLLNIAYMTAGLYPTAVPAKWLIPIQQKRDLNAEARRLVDELPQFRNIAPALGLDVLAHAGSSSLEDFDQDGHLDILTSSYHLNEQLEFFHNDLSSGYSKQTNEVGLYGIRGGLNFIHGDVNNDDRMDVYLTRGAWLNTFGSFPNSLLINLGSEDASSPITFVDRTEHFGLLESHPSQSAAFADFNVDGYLDLFVGYEAQGAENLPCKLYINQEGKSFKDVSKEAGVSISKYVKGVTVGDYNNDGLPDLYLSVLGNSNILFENKGLVGEQLQFLDVSKEKNVAEPIHSFPTAFFDYDNDGWEDLFVSGYDAKNDDRIVEAVAANFMGEPAKYAKPCLYKNINGSYFKNVTDSMGLGHELYTMGFNYGDLNGDGYLDLFLGTGDFSLSSIMPNRVFLNDRGKRFIDVTFDRKFGSIQKGHGVSFGDIDNDGDEDIYHVLGGATKGDVFHNMLYENQGNGNNWITFLLKGKAVNRSAIGTKVLIAIGAQKIYRTVTTGGSFGNNSLQLEMGIGKAEKVDSLVVYWHNKNQTQSIYTDLIANEKYIIAEDQANAQIQ